jgi:hypothetical protein
MKQLQGKTEGPVSIEEDTTLHGIITIGATVRKGAVFKIHGMITGDLTVEDGAEAIVHGMVNGTILNSGQVVIFGTADALVDSGPEARSVIDKRAFIRNGH